MNGELALCLLFWSPLVGLTASGIVRAVRTLPPVARWMMDGRKPWACDVCMAFWTCAKVTFALAAWQGNMELLVVAGPAYPIALWCLKKISERDAVMPSLEE